MDGVAPLIGEPRSFAAICGKPRSPPHRDSHAPRQIPAIELVRAQHT
jgi:hypothetical protein